MKRVRVLDVTLVGFSFLVLLLQGCTTVKLGEPYDSQIEDGLNSYEKSAVEFIKSSEQNYNNSKGAYDSEVSKKYYASADATLANLQIRADILSTRECPVARVAQLAALLGTSGIDADLAQAEKRAGVPVDQVGPTNVDASGNCVSIVIRGVRLAQANLEADHREKGKISPTVALLDREEIDAAVRVALTTVQAKK